MGTDIKLDPDSLDLPPYSSQVDGLDLLQQRLRIRLSLHRGEILSDASKGLPWLSWLQTRPVPLAIIRAAVRREVAACPGVARVDDVTASLSTARALVISVSATAEGGLGTVQARLQALPGGNLAIATTVKRAGRVMSGAAARR